MERGSRWLVSCATARKPKTQTDEEFLTKLTHLHVDSMGLVSLETIDWTHCKSLRALFASGNRIREIRSGLNALSGSLVELHLQNNVLERLDGIQSCTELQKLVLDFNRLQVIDHLENCTQLRELHVSRQQLPAGTSLSFDQRAAAALSASLEILVASGNRLSHLPIPQLPRVRMIDLSWNEFGDLDQVSSELAAGCRAVTRVSFDGNGAARNRRYRESLVLALPNLDALDGREISQQEREFLSHLRKPKEQK